MALVVVLMAFGEKDYIHSSLLFGMLDVQGQVSFGPSLGCGALASDDFRDGVIGPTLLSARSLAVHHNL